MAENEKLNNVAVDNDVGTMEDVDAIMKKYDRESNTRVWEGTPRKILRVLTALFGIFLIVMNMWIKMDERARRPLFLGLVIILVFIYYPIKKGSQKVNYMPWYDIVMAAVGAFCFFFYPLNLEKIVSAGTRIQKAFVVQIGSISIPLLIVFAIIGTLILVECCRRVVGMPIICVAAVFVLYAFLGAGKDLKTVMYNLFYTTTGILGTPIGVCSTYIALFVIFGAFLEATGVANFFIDCANALVGWASGGPAKVAVVSSALCGMVSGSSVGNTVTTGSVTIPMMKKTGYPPEFAGVLHRRSDHAPDHGRCGVPDGGNGRRSLCKDHRACDPARIPVLPRYLPRRALQGQEARPQGPAPRGTAQVEAPAPADLPHPPAGRSGLHDHDRLYDGHRRRVCNAVLRCRFDDQP